MNDSVRDSNVLRPSSSRIGTAITAFTVVAALALAFFGSRALAAPAELLPAGAGLEIYGQFMAVRNFALVLGLVAAIFLRDRTILATVLAIGGVVQLGDALIGIAHQSAQLIISPGILAALYFLSARYWFTHRRA